MTAPGPVLSIRGLEKRFAQRGGRGVLRALGGVDLELARGEILGLAGESGCGKTTLARCVLGLERPEAGSIRVAGEDMTALGGRELRALRRRAQLVFQDPFSSLNPRRRIAAIVAEGLVVHRLARGRERARRVAALLERVGLDPELGERFPRALSGGQRQRVGIARALACEPELLIADEPVSALDVSVQAQILRLLADLREEMGLGLLIISHDLAVLRQICDRVAVMYAGRIVEEGSCAAVLERPRHPYTEALLAALPIPEPGAVRPGSPPAGEPPDAARLPSGCSFHPRCPEARPTCATDPPPELVKSAERALRCPPRHREFS